ncbi:Uma2 family endonuclease [Brasilonema bromeliae]|uniref:Uma2 family endonuclease n=1 Tax=Brasilonema bromeliae SPC951 TaxID=385972 RepID=A0ABX1P9W2_9CYAN|nr:Uma2 family endonuclease [Brasilonema bromeliae]NMG21079.1 Uma2 family endonuclease [Brasilonema bromeliae SPC951]
MTIASKSKLTLEEFLKLPDTKPASEYINGEIIQKQMPQGEHSLIQTSFCELINGVGKKQKIAIAFPELRCTYPAGSRSSSVYGGQSIVPDVTVFRWERIPLKPSGRIANRFEIHPDWAIEILSPDQRQTKVLGNLLYCSRCGTELAWLIDPEEESVLAVFPNQRVEVYEGSAQLPILNNIELELTVEQIFSWLTLS